MYSLRSSQFKIAQGDINVPSYFYDSWCCQKGPEQVQTYLVTLGQRRKVWGGGGLRKKEEFGFFDSEIPNKYSQRDTIRDTIVWDEMRSQRARVCVHLPGVGKIRSQEEMLPDAFLPSRQVHSEKQRADKCMLVAGEKQWLLIKKSAQYKNLHVTCHRKLASLLTSAVSLDREDTLPVRLQRVFLTGIKVSEIILQKSGYYFLKRIATWRIIFWKFTQCLFESFIYNYVPGKVCSHLHRCT